MTSIKQVLLMQGTSICIVLFRGFVLESLWNWFVVPAANAPPISYWPMVGLSIFVGILIARDDPKTAELTLEAIDFCVSTERSDDYQEWLAEKNGTMTRTLWLQILGRFGILAEALVGGWVIHAALSAP